MTEKRKRLLQTRCHRSSPQNARRKSTRCSQQCESNEEASDRKVRGFFFAIGSRPGGKALAGARN